VLTARRKSVMERRKDRLQGEYRWKNRIEGTMEHKKDRLGLQ
jgi:hypothetical protein